MTINTYIIKNALRNKRRATLTVLSVAVSLFLLVTLLVALREITTPVEDEGAALRIVVRHKVSLASLLPARQRSIIERIPGVAAVSPFSFFGGKFRDQEGTLFAQFALDPPMLPKIFGEAKIPADQMEAFIADRQGCIVGKLTADKYQLKIGEKIPFTGTLYPCTLELVVRGFYSGTPDDRNVLFHHKYLDEVGGVSGMVGTWWVKARSIEEMSPVIDAINEAFANSSAEVRAETERAFQLNFISMWADIKMLVNVICSVVVFTLMLVTMSTMGMTIRERFRELAVLKAIGFRRRELFVCILAESFGLAMAGGLLGVGSAWGLYTYTQVMQSITGGIFITFEVTPKILGIAALVAAGLGVAASILPAVSVARASVVDGLKTLD